MDNMYAIFSKLVFILDKLSQSVMLIIDCLNPVLYKNDICDAMVSDNVGWSCS